MDTPPGFVAHPGNEDFLGTAVKIVSLPSKNGLTEGMLLRSILLMK